MANNILDAYKHRLREQLNSLADDMTGGGCLAVGDASLIAVKYAEQVGIVTGLALAERHLLDLLEETEEKEKLDT